MSPPLGPIPKVRRMGREYGLLGPFSGILGTLPGTCRVNGRYIILIPEFKGPC